MRFPRIVKALDQRVFLESCLNDSALYALTAPMNQPHFPKSGPVRLIHVLLDHRFDVSGREGVKIDRVFNRDFQRLRSSFISARGALVRSAGVFPAWSWVRRA